MKMSNVLFGVITSLSLGFTHLALADDQQEVSINLEAFSHNRGGNGYSRGGYGHDRGGYGNNGGYLEELSFCLQKAEYTVSADKISGCQKH